MNPQLLQLICFYLFGFIAVVAALAVITLKNTVHAVLSLVLTFFSAACLWMLADAEFLALALIVVYVGAVMVLFLFVVMMLDIDQEKMREGFVKFLPMGLIVAAAMLVEMLGLIGVKAMHAQAMGADPGLLDHGVAHQAADAAVPVWEGVDVVEPVMRRRDRQDAAARPERRKAVALPEPRHEHRRLVG